MVSQPPFEGDLLASSFPARPSLLKNSRELLSISISRSILSWKSDTITLVVPTCLPTLRNRHESFSRTLERCYQCPSSSSSGSDQGNHQTSGEQQLKLDSLIGQITSSTARRPRLTGQTSSINRTEQRATEREARDDETTPPRASIASVVGVLESGNTNSSYHITWEIY
jgi:hypothetical protein